MAELFGLLFFALAALLFFGLITSLIILIVMAVRKKPVKNAGIMSGVLGGSFIFVVILMFVALVNVDNTVPQTASYPASSSDAQDEETEVEEEIDLATEEVEEEPDEIDEIIAEADERIEQREKEEQAALENRPDTSNRDNYRTDVDVRDIERNPDEYMHELVVFEGRSYR